MKELHRINVGCGRTLTEGWLNMDNSVAIRLARHPWLVSLLRKAKLLKEQQVKNIEFQRVHDVKFCDARKHIPCADGGAEIVYSSHMLEHLDPDEVTGFLREVRRVLVRGGTLRLAVPNLKWHVDNYRGSGDANEFMLKTKLGRKLPKGLWARSVAAILGEREFHIWMYDEISIVRLLEQHGFINAATYPAGQTRLQNPGALNLAERAPESLFAEATNP